MFGRLSTLTYRTLCRASTKVSPYYVARHASSISTPLARSEKGNTLQNRRITISNAKFSTETGDQAIMKLVPKDLAPMLIHAIPDCFSSIPEEAWDMAAHMYKKGYALTACLELLSDTDQAHTPEVQSRISLLLSPFDFEDTSLVTLQKEQTRLGPLLELMEELLRIRLETQELHAMIRDAQSEIDTATKALPNRGLMQNEIEADENIQSWVSVRDQTKQELAAAHERVTELENEVLGHVLPKDVDDHRNAILEVRPGTGGDEAMLFARDIFHMYENVAREMSWRFEVNEVHPTETGGYREASATITLVKLLLPSLVTASSVHSSSRLVCTVFKGSLRPRLRAASTPLL